MTQTDQPSDETTDNPSDAPSLGESSISEQIDRASVPTWLTTAASFSWRLLVVAAAAAVAGFIVARFQVIIVPLLIAAMIAAVLVPPARWLIGSGWPPLLATWTVFLIAAIVLGGLGLALYPTLSGGFGDIGPALGAAYETVRTWLIDGPLGLDAADLDATEQRLADRFGEALTANIASRAAVAVEIVAGFFLTLVITFFYIKDGVTMRDRALGFIPAEARPRVASSLKSGWSVLQRYLLGVVVVGTADALLIGLGLWLIGVPLILPLMLLTFLGAFFPLVGAIVAGAIAALIALGSLGLGAALLVLALTIVVQQVDGDVIAPVVYSRAVDLHPLGILLALTAGSIIAGVVGAFLAVPVMAVSVAAVKEYRAFGETAGDPA